MSLVDMPVNSEYNREKEQEVPMMPDRRNDLQKEDDILLLEAECRLAANSQQVALPWNIVLEEFGITEEELEEAEDAAIE